MTFKNLRIRDPFVFKYKDIFYVTGTTNESLFEIFLTRDFKTIISKKVIFDLKKENIVSECAWAPEIHKYKNKFYLFFTLKLKGNHRGSYIAVSDKIDGDYKLISNNSITPSNQDCLDATLFVENNTPYIIYCHEWVEVRNGEIWIAELSKDLKKIVSTPQLLFTAKDAKWSSPIEKDGYVTDGPFILKREKCYCMLWSSFFKGKYALSIVKSKSLFGNWKQQEIPTFINDEGHGMIFKNENQFYIAMHHPNTYPNERIKIYKINKDNL